MTAPPPRILNVDDDEAGRYAVSRQLKQAGYEMLEASTGVKGLEMAETAKPDLILLDVRLPDVDGFEVCRRLRESVETAGIPVIQISASYIDASSRVKGLNNGADAYLIRPADPAVLAATINSLLRMKRAEASVRRDAREWRDTFDALQDGVALLDASGQVVRNNYAYSDLLQTQPERLAAMIGDIFHSLRSSRKRQIAQEVFQDKTLTIKLDPVNNELEAFDGAVCTICDVSERVRFEQQMRHTAKIESLGILAGGIAHDFNNLLTGILGNASLILETLPSESPEAEYATEIMRAGESAADLTRQILAYSGKGSMVTRNLDISSVVTAVHGMIRRLLAKNVEVVFEMSHDLPPVFGDAGQIQQIAMNLIINASESYPATSGGTISVSTDMVDLRSDFNHIGPRPVVAGPYVRLTVADSGCGMDSATQSKIFDPFFTTKFTGRGLGLSAVHGILRSHNGYLRLTSKPGEGTTFEVYFPVSTSRTQIVKHGAGKAKSPTGGTILVVDDEDIVRSVARSALEMHGYEVLTADDGKAGLELFRSKCEAIDMVLLDYSMPVMDGEEALGKIQSISRSVPVVLSSGYGESSSAERFKNGIIAGFLPKPYKVSELIAVTEQAIGRKKPV